MSYNDFVFEEDEVEVIQEPEEHFDEQYQLADHLSSESFAELAEKLAMSNFSDFYNFKKHKCKNYREKLQRMLREKQDRAKLHMRSMMVRKATQDTQGYNNYVRSRMARWGYSKN